MLPPSTASLLLSYRITQRAADRYNAINAINSSAKSSSRCHSFLPHCGVPVTSLSSLLPLPLPATSPSPQVMSHSSSLQPLALDEFRAELAILAAVEHPHIIKLFGSGRASSDGRYGKCVPSLRWLCLWECTESTSFTCQTFNCI